MSVLPKVTDKTVASSLRLLFIFNLLDAFLTILWINSGIAIEANPIMAAAMSHGMSFFVLIKITAVTLAIAVLWSTRSNRLSRYASVLSSTSMGIVVIYHVLGVLGVAHL